MSAQEISVFVCIAILFVIVFCFFVVVRSIARAEVNKALKAYVIGHLIQPRTSKGRFRSRHDRRESLPKPVAVTVKEGGVWLPWEDFQFDPPARNPNAVHSIKFEDGSVFDTVNGWRHNRARSENG